MTLHSTVADVSVSVLSHKQCHLGEGPSFDASDGTLYWFDILGRKLHGLHAETGRESEILLPKMGTAIFSVDADRQLILMEDGFHVRFRQSGVMALAIPVEADNPLTRSNDARSHPCGAIWFGTMGKQAEDGAGSIYHFHKGKVTKLYPSISIPNAICFSPDGLTAYHTGGSGAILRASVDPETGLPNSDWQEFSALKDLGYPDGAVVDDEGYLWNARWGAGIVIRIAPDGEVVQVVDVPVRRHSSTGMPGRTPAPTAPPETARRTTAFTTGCAPYATVAGAITETASDDEVPATNVAVVGV